LHRAQGGRLPATLDLPGSLGGRSVQGRKTSPFSSLAPATFLACSRRWQHVQGTGRVLPAFILGYDVSHVCFFFSFLNDWAVRNVPAAGNLPFFFCPRLLLGLGCGAVGRERGAGRPGAGGGTVGGRPLPLLLDTAGTAGGGGRTGALLDKSAMCSVCACRR
jgi:hypothetical protein